MDVCCQCCVVLSGRGLCDGLITRPEESYGLCDLEISRMMRPWPIRGGGGFLLGQKQTKKGTYIKTAGGWERHL